MLLLSYPLSEKTPFYGNSQDVAIKQSRSISKGDTANTLELHFSNHSGTHIDAPYHFDSKGKKITDYTQDFWFCKNVLNIESPKLPMNKEQLGVSHFREAFENFSYRDNKIVKSYAYDHTKIEALIWKTGWCYKRPYQQSDNRTCDANSDENSKAASKRNFNTDFNPTEYTTAGPGISAELADHFREAFPSLRFFGFDLISLSSFANREEGRRSHRAFLCHKQPILPIEDMDLRTLPPAAGVLRKLLISPLFINDADGAPVTVWGNWS